MKQIAIPDAIQGTGGTEYIKCFQVSNGSLDKVLDTVRRAGHYWTVMRESDIETANHRKGLSDGFQKRLYQEIDPSKYSAEFPWAHRIQAILLKYEICFGLTEATGYELVEDYNCNRPSRVRWYVKDILAELPQSRPVTWSIADILDEQVGYEGEKVVAWGVFVLVSAKEGKLKNPFMLADDDYEKLGTIGIHSRTTLYEEDLVLAPQDQTKELDMVLFGCPEIEGKNSTIVNSAVDVWLNGDSYLVALPRLSEAYPQREIVQQQILNME